MTISIRPIAWDDWENSYGDLVSAIGAFEGLSDEPIKTAERLVSVAASLSLSPTLTQQATTAGVLLGTAAYMAPE